MLYPAGETVQYIRTGRHCAFVLHAHLVFVTKCRHKVFTDAHLKRTEEITRAVCVDFDCELPEFNGENNHVHLLVNFPPEIALSKLVNSLKGVSPAGSARSTPKWSGTTGGHSACGPARTSPDRWAGLRSRSSVSTSSSRTVRSSPQVRALLRITSPPG